MPAAAIGMAYDMAGNAHQARLLFVRERTNSCHRQFVSIRNWQTSAMPAASGRGATPMAATVMQCGMKRHSQTKL